MDMLREPMDAVASNPSTAVSWGAILAGAVAAAALSLILLALGTGLGLSSISPWAYQGASATTLGVAAIVWLLLMSLVASGLGGYVAGRLRVKWTDADADEVYFRDTAHGFLAWAVATVITAALLTSAASSMVGTAAKVSAGGGAAAIGTAGGVVATEANASDTSTNYFVDMMLRSGKPAEAGTDMNATRREVGGILTNAIAGELSQGDRTYLAQLVANRTGLSATDAEQRVMQTTNAARLASEAAQAKAKELAEAARKVTTYAALWVFVSLLVGAFYAAIAATWGGRQRDVQSYLRKSV